MDMFGRDSDTTSDGEGDVDINIGAQDVQPATEAVESPAPPPPAVGRALFARAVSDDGDGGDDNGDRDGNGGETKGEDTQPPPPHPPHSSTARPVKTLPRPAYDGDKRALIDLCGWGGSGDVDEARDLIAQGITVNELDVHGQTALMHAVQFNHLEIVQELIRAGAALDLQANGQTTLAIAREMGHTEMATLLEEAEAAAAAGGSEVAGSVNEADECGGEGKARDGEEEEDSPAPPPSSAAQPVKTLPRPAYEGDKEALIKSRNVDEARDLIARGINIDEQDSSGKTALMWAALYNRLEMAQELIRAGATLDVQDRRGWTALMNAVSFNHFEIVQELIRGGAALDLQDNKYGQTTLTIAQFNDYTEIATLLREAGARCPGYKRSGVFNSKCKRCWGSKKGHSLQ